MSSTNKEGRTPLYSPALKIAVAREYLTSNLGYGRLAVKHHLKNAGTVKTMVKWYHSKYPDALAVPVIEAEVPVVPPSVMDKQLQEANLKIMALELLLANVSREVGVDVVKKFGTKQSPR